METSRRHFLTLALAGLMLNMWGVACTAQDAGSGAVVHLTLDVQGMH